ncbi:unnamed protein product [Closterium sp. NIES-65]|nr:unnamed protein product [Closterium sp. NIES-65]
MRPGPGPVALPSTRPLGLPAAPPPYLRLRPSRLTRPSSRPPRRPAAAQPNRPAAEPPGAEPPGAEPPSSRAAQQQSRQAARQPRRRAAEPPSRPTTGPPELPSLVWVDDLQLFLQCDRVDDLQLFLQCDRADGLSLFNLTSGTSPAPATDADATIRSQWATRDAAARLAVRRHLPTSERAHFSQYKSAQTLYDAAFARYSSPATAALSRLMLPGVPPPPFCPLLPLVLRPTSLVLSRSVRRLPLAGDAALARARGAGALEERAGAVEVEVAAVGGLGVAVGVEVGVEGSVAAVEAEEAAAVAVGAEVAEVAALEEAAEAAAVAEAAEAAGVAVELVAGLRRGVAPVVARASSSSAVVRPCPLSSSVSGTLHASGVGVLVRAPTSCAPATVRGELSRAGVAIYDLDFDAILSAMYAVSISDEGDCYRCFPPDPGIETAALGTGEAAALGACDAAALGASVSASSGTGESALSGTTSASASLTFTLDSGASRSFFLDRTTLTPLSRPVAVSLADPSGGPVLSRFSTVLPCPAAPSGTLSGLYLPSFSTNLVSGADLQDAGAHQFTPARQRVTHCTEASTGRHLATFTRQPGSSLYTLTTASPPVTESGRVAASVQVFAAASRSSPESAPCSCPLLSHETLLWHHRLGHPSLLRLRSMASRLLASGLPRSLPPLPQGPGPTCVPCVEGRQRAAPHSSQFPPTEAPLQTLHMDVWGPARVRGQGHERYFLLVVDDYSRYTAVFPLRSKGDVTEVLIDWIRAACLQLRQSFGSDFPVLRLHSERGGEFSSGLLRAYCRARGIRQTFTLPDSPQQNGIAERRIGMVMDVARKSMMHAAAPHFLWPFAVRYAAHQINLHPRVSRPETSPALLWTGKVGDASAFRVWGSRAFVRDLSTDKLSPRAAPCVFLGFPPDAPGWQFYHPTSRRVLSSQNVAFDESVPYYYLFPYRTPSLPPPPLFLVPGPPPVDPLPPQGPAPSGVSQVDALEPVEVSGDSGAAEGAEPGGADSEVLSLGVLGLGPGGAEPGGAEPGGAEPGGALPGGAGPGGAPHGGSPGASSRREPLSPQELREWFARRWSRAAGAGGSSATKGAAVAGPRGARTWSTGAAGPAGSTGAGAAEGVGAEPTAGGPAGGTTGAAGGSGAAGGAAGGPTRETAAVRARREPASRPTSLVRAARTSGRGSRQRPPPVPGMHRMSLRPSTAPLRAPLSSPPESSLPALADPESDSLRAASPTVTRLLATVVTDPSFESTAASALVAELVDFAARCRLDYAASLVAESESACPPSVGGECALGTDVLEDRQEEFQCLAAASPHLVSVLLTPEGDPDALDIPTPRSYAEAIEGPYSSQWHAAMDAEMASWKSTGTYVDAVPPLGANIISGMWIFTVKWPPGSPPVFKARYVAPGFMHAAPLP